MTATRAGNLLQCIFLAMSLTGLASVSNAETLVLQGSTTFSRNVMEPYQTVIEEKSGHDLTVIPNKSTPGMIALFNGSANLAMISAPFEAEVQSLSRERPELPFARLRGFEIARPRIAIAVNKTNSVRRITRDALTKMLQGDIANWRALGGPDLPIRIVLVDGGGGVTTTLESELLSGKRARSSNVIYVKTPVQLVQVVEQEPGAIGFAQLALVKQRGIPEATLDKPIEQVLILVSLDDPTQAMREVIKITREVAQEKLM